MQETIGWIKVHTLNDGRDKAPHEQHEKDDGHEAVDGERMGRESARPDEDCAQSEVGKVVDDVHGKYS
ncbi:hypothetical protein GCM10025871_05230 [Deinococcus metallilatus]|nr:hypothetical protein GCM10025871_05230 [Deinococcus metallilatus]